MVGLVGEGVGGGRGGQGVNARRRRPLPGEREVFLDQPPGQRVDRHEAHLVALTLNAKIHDALGGCADP
jgi:hypothetical protein